MADSKDDRSSLAALLRPLLRQHEENHSQPLSFSHPNIEPASPSRTHRRQARWTAPFPSHCQTPPATARAPTASQTDAPLEPPYDPLFNSAREHVALAVLSDSHAQLALRLSRARNELNRISERKALLSWRQLLRSPSETRVLDGPLPGLPLRAHLQATSMRMDASSSQGHVQLSAREGEEWQREQRVLDRVWEEEVQARETLRGLEERMAFLSRVVGVAEQPQETALQDSASTFVNWPGDGDEDGNGNGNSSHTDNVATVVNVLRMLDPQDLAGVYRELGL